MLEILTWLKDGKYRIKILTLLSQRSYLPTELSNALKIDRASISRVLKSLKQKELVEVITPKSRTSSYVISKKGIQVMDYLKKEMK
jgi:DNA-binding MarR family transcriptional regulator